MKLRLFFMLCFVATLLPLSSSPVRADEWVISPARGVGWITLGETMSKVEEYFGKTKDRMGTLLFWYKNEGLEFYAPSSVVERIIIVKPSFLDRHYATSNGITIGTSCEEVLRTYGPSEKSIYTKDTYTLNYVEQGITFFIRNEEVCKILLYRGTSIQGQAH
jgi:hypothetical protein